MWDGHVSQVNVEVDITNQCGNLERVKYGHSMPVLFLKLREGNIQQYMHAEPGVCPWSCLGLDRAFVIEGSQLFVARAASLRLSLDTSALRLLAFKTSSIHEPLDQCAFE